MKLTPRRLTPLLGLVSLGLAASLHGGTAIASDAARSRQPAPPPRSVQMAPPSTSNPTNPLAGHPWGVYQGLADPAWGPYLGASDSQKRLLSRIVFQPKAKFFGRWLRNDQIAQKVHEYIDNANGGDPNVLVQLTLFRMNPWETEACQRLPTVAERASYKDYIDRFARAIGNSLTAVVVQPDGPDLRCVPHNSRIPANLLKYTAQTLNALPNTTVYLEMGSNDWWRGDITEAVHLLLLEGVAGVRGFALDTSHFDSVARQITFGTRIVRSLASKGVEGKHFVIDTSDNGRPFTGKWWHKSHPVTLAVGHALACQRPDQTRCVTLGIPPTTDVASTRWGLTATQRGLASTYVDGYLWVSRPWLSPQSGPLNMQRALDEARTTPYQ